MRSIRASINRHLQSPPNNLQIDITRDSAFKQANQVFDGYLKQNKRDGLDTTVHKEVINDEDWVTLQSNTSVDDPASLQDKVFLDLLTHFGKRGREGLRQLKKTSYIIKRDPQGLRYIEEASNELTKNHQHSTSSSKDETRSNRIMAEQPEDPRCPVKSYQSYLSHLDPNTDILFTKPLKLWKGKEIWFSANPLGVNTLGDKLKKMSKKNGLSSTYTNHCVRATVVTRLARQGVDPLKICNVTGHRNISSIQHYMAKPTLGSSACSH